MKNYHNSEGCPDYEAPKVLFEDLANSYYTWQDATNLDFATQRLQMYEIVHAIRHNYSIHKSLGGLGGCKNLEEYWEAASSSELEHKIKAIFKDYVTNEYMPQDFLLLIHDLICMFQIALHNI